MDLVRILSEAIARLPKGDHSAGLAAIMRHISIAIRHFERRGERDADSFTDAIYRTNQAYEGSLKEAYRVLAGKDPSGKTPNEIEKYLEAKDIIRPRVLTQLTRYRHDYRNPSTHDYKLDFDEDEALLAIVSVCAFAKLLVDQISEQLAFRAAASRPPPGELINLNLNEYAIFVSTILRAALEFTREVKSDITESEFAGGLAGKLASIGLTASLDTKIVFDEDEEFTWDIFITFGDNKLPIETRLVTGDFDESGGYGTYFVSEGIKFLNLNAGLVLLRGQTSSDYKLYECQIDDLKIYIITQWGVQEIDKMHFQFLGNIREIS